MEENEIVLKSIKEYSTLDYMGAHNTSNAIQIKHYSNIEVKNRLANHFLKKKQYYLQELVSALNFNLDIEQKKVVIICPNHDYYVKIEKEKLQHLKKFMRVVVKTVIATFTFCEYSEDLGNDYTIEYDIQNKDLKPYKDKNGEVIKYKDEVFKANNFIEVLSSMDLTAWEINALNILCIQLKNYLSVFKGNIDTYFNALDTDMHYLNISSIEFKKYFPSNQNYLSDIYKAFLSLKERSVEIRTNKMLMNTSVVLDAKVVKRTLKLYVNNDVIRLIIDATQGYTIINFETSIYLNKKNNKKIYEFACRYKNNFTRLDTLLSYLGWSLTENNKKYVKYKLIPAFLYDLKLLFEHVEYRVSAYYFDVEYSFDGNYIKFNLRDLDYWKTEQLIIEYDKKFISSFEVYNTFYESLNAFNLKMITNIQKEGLFSIKDVIYRLYEEYVASQLPHSKDEINEYLFTGLLKEKERRLALVSPKNAVQEIDLFGNVSVTT